MTAVTAMSKDQKKRSAEASTASRSAFWNGVLEGFGGPLMMGAPVRGCLQPSAKRGRRTFNIKVDGGTISIETASLAKSSKQVAAALQHATKGVMSSRKLVYRILNDRTVGKDGKFHPVKRMTVEAADPSNEPRQQSRVDAHFAPRRG
jgi:hypothetical protein